MYGVDVALTRADDLDKKMLAYVTEHMSTEKRSNDVLKTSDVLSIGEVGLVTVLDLGCGGGGQSLRLTSTGAQVLCVDVADYSDSFNTLRKEHDLSATVLLFIQGDAAALEAVLDDQKFDICCFQRTIHYVPYDTALIILKCLRTHITDKLYISVTGIESDIGLNYNDTEKPVEGRFCTLGVEDSEIFHIDAPVCLYTPEEFMVLLQDSGWKIEECWVSAFGNIKAVCS
ncbi:MAG: SAM-dependent methyltransferase [Acidimicrobiales bacterium]|jgi:SAM-dependent methyltransferase